MLPFGCAALLAFSPAPAPARDTLGVFEGWGAFRDAVPARCYAIAEPAARSRGSAWRAFAAVSTWPGRRVRGQLHIRLSRAQAPGQPIMLSLGDRSFPLIAGGADAWAPDRRADAAIVAAMRSASSMSVEGHGLGGAPFVDAYRLRGAATAIDAAALGCARIG
ncbi:hypothetical protein [Flavisphingomonas formosensis]|uniref:hypothetical protein n=1 Tax=Flavisphingomonas formosensis TaxID=861534 RepID=UPI0012F7C21D